MSRPTVKQLARAVKLVGLVVGARRATYCFGGRFAVPLEAGWGLMISADDAERFRVEVCYSGRVRATMWCVADDDDRLAELAAAAKTEAAALVA